MLTQEQSECKPVKRELPYNISTGGDTWFGRITAIIQNVEGNGIMYIKTVIFFKVIHTCLYI